MHISRVGICIPVLYSIPLIPRYPNVFCAELGCNTRCLQRSHAHTGNEKKDANQVKHTLSRSSKGNSVLGLVSRLVHRQQECLHLLWRPCPLSMYRMRRQPHGLRQLLNCRQHCKEPKLVPSRGLIRLARSQACVQREFGFLGCAASLICVCA